ncbi:hypothetical protein OG301_38995 (plasmid) [Streptomyces platensis]|uniref:hypothetical protein n=1 Tax=Streptomyces platensis TaxID=58346 RepID=UPI002ED14289|nr:hypothetical protein OG301_38995 [Streptomyces platensis]
MSDSPELKAAYQRLEGAINEVTRLEGFKGVLVEWVIVAASQRYDEDGDGITQIGVLVPDGGGQVPYHRIMGLLDYALTRQRAEILNDDE